MERSELKIRTPSLDINGNGPDSLGSPTYQTHKYITVGKRPTSPSSPSFTQEGLVYDNQSHSPPFSTFSQQINNQTDEIGSKSSSFFDEAKQKIENILSPNDSSKTNEQRLFDNGKSGKLLEDAKNTVEGIFRNDSSKPNDQKLFDNGKSGKFLEDAKNTFEGIFRNDNEHAQENGSNTSFLANAKNNFDQIFCSDDSKSPETGKDDSFLNTAKNHIKGIFQNDNDRVDRSSESNSLDKAKQTNLDNSGNLRSSDLSPERNTYRQTEQYSPITSPVYRGYRNPEETLGSNSQNYKQSESVNLGYRSSKVPENNFLANKNYSQSGEYNPHNPISPINRNYNKQGSINQSDNGYKQLETDSQIHHNSIWPEKISNDHKGYHQLETTSHTNNYQPEVNRPVNKAYTQQQTYTNPNSKHQNAFSPSYNQQPATSPSYNSQNTTNINYNQEQATSPNYKKEKSTDCDSALIPLHCVHG